MLSLLNKTRMSLKRAGFRKTFLKIIRYPVRHQLNLIQRRNFEEKILSLSNVEDRFTEIYKRNYWGSEESVSGYGSTLEFTANLRANLPELFKRFSIKSIFDAPCGDFNWMRHVLKENDLHYIGGDIVLPLVDSHNSKYRNPKTRFIHIDLTKDKFPYADLMICRDCLFHLSFRDAKLVLQNFVDSNIAYLLTTTYVNSKKLPNQDISTGDCRFIDLLSAPYNFPADVAFRIEDPKTPEPIREMCLWTREQIIEALAKFQ